MLALDLQPFICVENRGFKELMNHMEPLYRIPSRTTFSRTIIPELYSDTVTAVKDRIHAGFQEGTEFISFTSDIEELQHYLREPTCTKDQDLLAFWKETGSKLPGLSKMAMKYMGILAMSVPSEKLFLMAGNIVTAHREKLTLDHVQQLLFLHENL
ncbi:hypothetical protein HPB49_016716 [Dermacentor silvarum]|uniref:Uncharacterized protein n=1 Tax=Dermacentor silvarum TaxID=543639 RepID=A0ACB8DJL2_DERSI|nr:hypothetical protein HPB49_016716 [Dermacentor silvarum]